MCAESKERRTRWIGFHSKNFQYFRLPSIARNHSLFTDKYRGFCHHQKKNILYFLSSPIAQTAKAIEKRSRDWEIRNSDEKEPSLMGFPYHSTSVSSREFGYSVDNLSFYQKIVSSISTKLKNTVKIILRNRVDLNTNEEFIADPPSDSEMTPDIHISHPEGKRALWLKARAPQQSQIWWNGTAARWNPLIK